MFFDKMAELSKRRARGPVEACLACAECADKVHGRPLGTHTRHTQGMPLREPDKMVVLVPMTGTCCSRGRSLSAVAHYPPGYRVKCRDPG